MSLYSEYLDAKSELISKDLNISVYSHLFLILLVATLNCLIGYVIQDITYQRLAYCDYKYCNQDYQ